MTKLRLGLLPLLPPRQGLQTLLRDRTPNVAPPCPLPGPPSGREVLVVVLSTEIFLHLFSINRGHFLSASATCQAQG